MLLDNPTRIKKKYIQTTNLTYIEAVYEALISSGGVVEVLRTVAVPVNDNMWRSRAEMIRHRSIKIDIVAESELVWIKVFAQNARAMRYEMAGLEQLSEDEDEDSDFGFDSNGRNDGDNEDEDGFVYQSREDDINQLPIFKKARDFLASAEAHHVHFRRPAVVFAFMRIRRDDDAFVGEMMTRLEKLGVIVHMLGDSSDSIEKTYSGVVKDVDPFDLTTPVLNIDVGTALALLSEMAHHACSPDEVQGEPLQIQAAREAVVPVLPQLRQVLEHKRLCMVQTAFDRLKNIVDVIGGPLEQARFRYLLRAHFGNQKTDRDGKSGNGVEVFDPDLWTSVPPLSITVVPDAPSEAFNQLLEPPARRAKLNNGRKIRTQFSSFHANVFGSGDTYRWTTVTSIQWMASALAEAGMTGVSIICHEPRSLAEQKMKPRT
ncbi:hypothetical protein J3Q64DRAFT_1214384 [Phycomyces blakesleeanus]|uniref:DUF1308 domain-containing protein n=1 Tax=Phycomyces blakesleeanus TaxID=4837 RepID=A0ABR3B9R8_PHYBL